MAMGKRPAARQASPMMWVETSKLPTSDGHLYFERLNRVLADSGFDAFVEELEIYPKVVDRGRETCGVSFHVNTKTTLAGGPGGRRHHPMLKVLDQAREDNAETTAGVAPTLDEVA